MSTPIRIVIVAVSLAALAYACGDSPMEPSGSATLNVNLTDTPFEDAMAVLVTFDEVSVHPADGDWIVVSATPRTCDLKKLQGTQDVLGIATLDPGPYTQIRLNVASAALYFSEATPPADPACAAGITPPTGNSATLEVSSGRVILNRPFELESETATTVTLDFDGDRSILPTGAGSYRMAPVIAVVSVQ